MLDHPVALVTGAARGIGAACARGLAAEGFRVVGHIGNRGQSPYTTAKAGLDALTRSLVRAPERRSREATWRAV